MKKTIVSIILGISSLTAAAQVNVKGAGFFDNWSASFTTGVVAPTTHAAFFEGVRPVYGLGITKKLTTVVSLGLQGSLANGVTASSTAIDASNVMLVAGFNLINLFPGYIGHPRPLEVEATAAAGWGHCFQNKADRNFLTTKYGLKFNFNFGKEYAWTFAVCPAIAYDMEGTDGHTSYNVNQSALELAASITYHFKNRNNHKRHFTIVRPYDPTKADALNAKINDLRSLLEKKNQEINALKSRNQQLEKQIEKFQQNKIEY